MSLLFLDGFDRYPAASGIGGMNTVWSEGWPIVSGRYFGGQAVRNRSTSNGGGGTRRAVDARQVASAMGFAYKPETFGCPIAYMTGPTGTICLSFDTTGRLIVFDRTWGGFGFPNFASIAAGTKVYSIQPNVWQYVEFAADVNLGTMQAWVNGELCLDISGYVWTDKTGFEQYGFWVSANHASYDDFYIKTGADPYGEIKIETINVEATVSNTGFAVTGAATAHGAINEVPVDGDTSYISSATPSDEARFQVSNLTSLPINIRAVQVRSFARKDETSVRTIRQQVVSNSVVAEGAEHYLGVGYQYYHDIFQVDPNTNAPWTNDAVNGLNIGIRVDQ